MSIEVVNHVLNNVPLSGNAKLVLLGIANHAHPDGGNAYPAIETLALYACVDRRTAQRQVRRLERDGWIQSEGFGPQGQVRYRVDLERRSARQPAATEEGGILPPESTDPDGGGILSPPSGGNLPQGGNLPGAAPESRGGGTTVPEGAAPVPPEPSRTVHEPSSGTESARDDDRDDDQRQRFPDDLPDELRPHATAVLPILQEVARDHAAGVVYPQAVGRVIRANPRKPLVAAAHALAAWAVDPPRPIRDVLSTYREFLRRERDLAATEPLDDHGRPATAAAPRAARGSGPGGRESVSDLLNALGGGATR